jgi:hypothetical protein
MPTSVRGTSPTHSSWRGTTFRAFHTNHGRSRLTPAPASLRAPAKQSIAPQIRRWIASSQVLLAMTGQTSSLSRRDPPEPCQKCFALEIKRARGMPGAQCTRSLVCAIGSKYAHQYSQRRHRKSSGIPHAMVLTVSFALSSVTNSFCHRRWRIDDRSAPGRADRSPPT